MLSVAEMTAAMGNEDAAIVACRTCRYYGSNQCRFASPVLGPNGIGGWPRVEESEWCGRWKSAIVKTVPKVNRFTDPAIIAMVEKAGSVDSDEFINTLAEVAGIHLTSARLRVFNLLHRHRLRETEDGRLTIYFAEEREQAPDDRGVRRGAGGRPGKNHFGAIRPLMSAYTAESPGRFTEILAEIRKGYQISNASFSRVLRLEIDAGMVGKTEDGKYFLVGESAGEQQPAAEIEAPEHPIS